jgi:hypothetical protein
MDALMKDIAGKPPIVKTRRTVEPIERLHTTLRKHYAKKRDTTGSSIRTSTTAICAGCSPTRPNTNRNRKASRFIHSIRRDVRRIVARSHRFVPYTIDRVITDIVARCDELHLRLKYPEDRSKLDFTHLVTVQTMN